MGQNYPVPVANVLGLPAYLVYWRPFGYSFPSIEYHEKSACSSKKPPVKGAVT
jgi:hypothetical protein